MIKHKMNTITTKIASNSFMRDVIELVLCIISIYTCYLVYGQLHEKITRQPYDTMNVSQDASSQLQIGKIQKKGDKFSNPLFLTFLQCTGSAFWALFLIQISAQSNITESEKEKDKENNNNNKNQLYSCQKDIYGKIFDEVPKYKYGIVATSYSLAMLCSTSALNYISYPVQALAKSSKLLPVMFGRMLFGVICSFEEYLHVSAITAGIAIFFYFDTKNIKITNTAQAITNNTVDQYSIIEILQSNSTKGLFLLMISLAMDAITGPLQENISSKYNSKVLTVTFWINIFPMVALYIYTYISGEFSNGIIFCKEHPSIIPDLILYCLLSALGQSIIVWALFRFNSMTVTVITTTRKFFSILTSVLFYRNPLTVNQWFGVFLVFFGIAANSRYKYLEHHKRITSVN